ADPAEVSGNTEQSDAFRWPILLLVVVVERTTVDLLNHAVGGVGRAEHEVAEQSQLCVKLLVVLGVVFWFGHAVGHVRARTVETALSRGTRRSGRRPRL